MATQSIWSREVHLWFLPKALFKWREPKAFLRAKDAEARALRRWWHQPLIIFITTALLMASWYFARFNPQKHPPSFFVALGLGIFGGVFLAYFAPWLMTFSPSEVRLYETYATRLPGNNNQRFKYVDIEYFAWRTTEGITTLVLKMRKTKFEMLLGVPNEISKNDVHLFLLSRDVMPQPGA